MLFLRDLFGKEDVDYRKLPTIPKKHPSDVAKSPSLGWSKFKQDRPETFSFKQPRRVSADTEMRSPLGASPLTPSSATALKGDPLSGMTNAEDILKFAEQQRERGMLSAVQHRDLLTQLAELVRLQKLREEARLRRQSAESRPVPELTPPPKPPLLDLPRKTLLPDPVAATDELPGSPGLSSHDGGAEGQVKQPLLPPPLPPRALLDAPRLTREPLLPAPGRPTHRLDPPELSMYGPMRRPRFGRGQPHPRGRPMFPPRGVLGDRPDHYRPRMRFMGPEAARFGGPRGGALEPVHGARPPLLQPPAPPGWIDINLPYRPDEDARWYRRVHFRRDASYLMTKYEVVINGNPYDLSITRRRNTERKIQFGETSRSVRLDPASQELFIDGNVYYRIHEHERAVMIGGSEYRIYVRGPTEKMWIDGHQFEFRLDAPPERVLIANASYDLYIDRQKKEVFVDGLSVCPYNKDKTHDVLLGLGRRHVFQFFPPARQILIDGEECMLDMSKRFPAVNIKGRWHGLRFDGPPREVLINDKAYPVSVDNPLKVKIDHRPYLLALGGPGHEIILEDEWYEVKFGGPPVFAKIGNFKTFKLQLEGGPPEVRILGVIEGIDDAQRAVTVQNYDHHAPAIAPQPNTGKIIPSNIF